MLLNSTVTIHITQQNPHNSTKSTTSTKSSKNQYNLPNSGVSTCVLLWKPWNYLYNLNLYIVDVGSVFLKEKLHRCNCNFLLSKIRLDQILSFSQLVKVNPLPAKISPPIARTTYCKDHLLQHQWLFEIIVAVLFFIRSRFELMRRGETQVWTMSTVEGINH